MELIYSMRRKPLKYEPPHFDNPADTEVVRPLCTISVCNIIAFSSPTDLTDTEGDSWAGYVYVCDLDTPWDSHKVTSMVHPISALEWDCEGKQLLVGTTAGDVAVYGQKDHLLNEWTCLYATTFPGEHIIKAIFFHNGRRVVAADKKPDALITDKFQVLRPAPTLKGFGGVWNPGALVITASGLAAAVCPGEGTRALTRTEPLRPARTSVTAAALAHKNGSILVAAVCAGSPRWCVRCYVVPPRAPPRPPPRAAPPLLLRPLPALHPPPPHAKPVSVSWSLREDTDCLLVAGGSLTLWQLAERSHPVHKLLAKAPLQGGTTTNGAPKPAADCFNTLVWQPTAPWPIEDGERAVTVLSNKSPLTAPHVLLATPHAVHLLSRDNHHYICSRPVPPLSDASESAGANTPPKKAKYGPGALPAGGGGGGGACVSCMDVSWLGGVAVCVDSRARLHVHRAPHADAKGPLGIQHICNLLEYSLVAGCDCLDLLLTLRPAMLDAVYERFTESFQRQPQSFQQYYYHGWLKLRIAICRLSAPLVARTSWLCCVQMCHAAWAGAAAALRPDAAQDALLLLLDDHDAEKTLLALEAKPESLGDVSALQALRRPLQRALDVALTALLALPHLPAHQLLPPHQHLPGYQPHGYEIWSEPLACFLLRKLVILARACGRGGEALSRPLCRLAALPAQPSQAAKHELHEECLSLAGAGAGAGAAAGAAWDCAPRCSVAAPHGKPYPLYLEYGVEPPGLRFSADPPAYLHADPAPARAMDCIRYMYLGGGGRLARWRGCGRCGARALAARAPARLCQPYDKRFLPACRCGGKWTLVSNV